MAEEAVEEVVEEVAETVEVEDVSTETPEPAAEVETSEVVDMADWRDGITDSDARKHAERFTTLEDMAKATLDGRKQLSKMITPLRANAKEEDVAAYNKALGVPERASDYEFTTPEGMDEADFEADDVKERIQAFADIAHANHVPAEAFDQIMQWYLQASNDSAVALQQADAAFAEQAQMDLKKDWGPQYEKEVTYANRGAEWAAEGDFEAFRQLEDKNGNFIGDHPLVVRMMNRVGRAMSEDGIGSFPIDTETSATLSAELNDLTMQQDELMRKGEHQAAQAIDIKIMELSRKISGDNPIHGA